MRGDRILNNLLQLKSHAKIKIVILHSDAHNFICIQVIPQCPKTGLSSATFSHDGKVKSKKIDVNLARVFGRPD